MCAKTIGFTRRIICHHRVNRPGQTMASTGSELAAFFIHFRTILAEIPDDRGDLRRQALRWLVGNMSWHIPRLQSSVFCLYATRAHSALRLIDDTDWQALANEMAASMTWHYANRLRQGYIWDVVEAWRVNVIRSENEKIGQSIRNLDKRLRDLQSQVKTTREIVQARSAIDEFTALQSLLDQASEKSVEGHVV